MEIKTIKVGYLETNCYLIINDNKCLIVDPGDDFDKIKNTISLLKLTPLKVLITHHHFDHVGCLNEVLREYNIDKIDYGNYIDDNNIVIIEDFKFKLIYTPGHKSDLITYYFYEDNIMFCGDFIFKDNIGRWDLDTGNKDEMIRSIAKIKNYPSGTIIYPGHGEITNLDYEIKNNIYFDV